MTQTTKRLKLDFYAVTQRECVTAKRHDDMSRMLEIELYDKGKRYEIPTGCLVIFVATAQNNRSIMREVLVEDNVIFITLEKSMLSRPGATACEIMLLERSTMQVLSSASFHIHVIPSVREKNPETVIETAGEWANLTKWPKKDTPLLPLSGSIYGIQWSFNTDNAIGAWYSGAVSSNKYGWFYVPVTLASNELYQLDIGHIYGWAQGYNYGGSTTLYYSQIDVYLSYEDYKTPEKFLLSDWRFSDRTQTAQGIVDFHEYDYSHEFSAPEAGTGLFLVCRIKFGELGGGYQNWAGLYDVKLFRRIVY